MEEMKLSATQIAAIEKIKELIKEYALIPKASFLYPLKDILKIMEKNLQKLDMDYINKYAIPDDLVKGIIKEAYRILMQNGEYDKAIILSEHYKL